MPRKPKYQEELLYETIREVLPVASTQWQRVVDIYHDRSFETVDRTAKDIRDYFFAKMCGNGKNFTDSRYYTLYNELLTLASEGGDEQYELHGVDTENQMASGEDQEEREENNEVVQSSSSTTFELMSKTSVLPTSNMDESALPSDDISTTLIGNKRPAKEALKFKKNPFGKKPFIDSNMPPPEGAVSIMPPLPNLWYPNVTSSENIKADIDLVQYMVIQGEEHRRREEARERREDARERREEARERREEARFRKEEERIRRMEEKEKEDRKEFRMAMLMLMSHQVGVTVVSSNGTTSNSSSSTLPIEKLPFCDDIDKDN